MTPAPRVESAASLVQPVPTTSEFEPFLRSLVESAILLLAISLAEPLFFKEHFYGTLPIHPFWLIILIAALQRGIFAGVGAAILACFFMEWPLRPIGVDITDHYIEIASQPLAWIVTALLIGAYRSTQIRQDARRSQELAQLFEENEALAAEIIRMDQVMAKSEVLAVTQSDQGSKVSPQTVKALIALLNGPSSRKDFGIAYDQISNLVSICPSALLFQNEDGSFYSETDCAAATALRLPLSGDHPLICAVIQSKQPVVMSSADVIAGTDGYIVAAAITKAKSITGVIVILAEDKECAELSRSVADLLVLVTTAAWSAVATDTSAHQKPKLVGMSAK